MAEFDNTNRGTLFVKDKTKDNDPDFNGTLNVGGVEYWIFAWKKTSKGGNKFLSLSIRQKQEQTRQSSQPTRKAVQDKDDFGDSSDIPW